MMPRLEIDLGKIGKNASELTASLGSKGISVMAVTKCVCGSPEIAKVLLDHGANSLGDSRLANIQRMRQSGIDGKFVLIRSPMPGEAEDVVRLADASCNTEKVTLDLLSGYAVKHRKRHGVILMVELGDLREGILPSNVGDMVEYVLELDGIELEGLGANFACIGGIKPDNEKMELLSGLAQEVRDRFGVKISMVSGGNSANYQWISTTENVGLINNLRIGEAILLGSDPLTRSNIPGLFPDAFTLVAEVIELKTKPSKPYGHVFQDVFGRIPHFIDRGMRKRAILAVGEQDVDSYGLRPREDVEVIRASSDIIVVDVTDKTVRLGDQIQFDVNYSALLRAMTSPYVVKVYH
ncbi:MAG: alanine/ornithine racemase family PLP-dependent enzyme [Anaerolineales bacterium]|nr:alanine/ornithine racemase family PLP-dependent enzyme [Anaerolineales bacterium]